MKIAIACLLFLTSVEVFAADRTEKIRVLMEAQGLVATFDQQIQLGKENSKRQADQMLSQLMSTLNAPPEVQARFKGALADFMTAMQPPWSAQDIVTEWAKSYGSRFTDDELDQLIAFYSSPLAQKEVVVGREALVPFTAHFQELYKPIQQQATGGLIERMQLIARECNCKKKAAPASKK